MISWSVKLTLLENLSLSNRGKSYLIKIAQMDRKVILFSVIIEVESV